MKPLPGKMEPLPLEMLQTMEKMEPLPKMLQQMEQKTEPRPLGQSPVRDRLPRSDGHGILPPLAVQPSPCVG